VNMFVGSSALQFALSVIGVLVFTGLIAFDTQRIKAKEQEQAPRPSGLCTHPFFFFLAFANFSD
jgi:FtsH-binding integral membrane protein